jgi:hypothetical protein
MLDTVIRVLFIGNSLTAANHLPATVAALARAAGVRIEYRVVAKPNFSLEDHWNDGDARKAIARGGWTFVVLQQGPSALPESQRLLIDYARRFDGLIRAAGATPAMFMVWPSRERTADVAGASRSYGAAARAVGGVLCAAGDAWQAAWLQDPRLPLYGPDGFHPSPLGSTLASIVIVEALTGRAPPADALKGVSAKDRAVLLTAAGAAQGRTPAGFR